MASDEHRQTFDETGSGKGYNSDDEDSGNPDSEHDEQPLIKPAIKSATSPSTVETRPSNVRFDSQSRSSDNLTRRISPQSSHPCVACPTCNGKGKLSQAQSDTMLALIPMHDQRLKPKRTKLKLAVVFTLLVVTGGMCFAFLYPRSVTISIANVEANSIRNFTKTISINMTVQAVVNNTNFFSVKLVNTAVQVLFLDTKDLSHHEVGNIVVNQTIKLGIREKLKKEFLLKTTYTEMDTKIVRRVCLKFKQYFLIKVQLTSSIKYWLHSEQISTNRFHYIECRSSTPFGKRMMRPWTARLFFTSIASGSTVDPVEVIATDSTSLAVTWTNVSCSLNETISISSQYQIFYGATSLTNASSCSSQNSSSKTVTFESYVIDANLTTSVNDTLLSFVISNLSKWTCYQVKVIRISDTGKSCGSNSSSVFAATLEDGPTKPRDVKSVAKSPWVVEISWIRPKYFLEDFQAYRVGYKKVSSTAWATLPDTINTKVDVSNLQPFTGYLFRVVCVSSGGISDFTETNTTTEKARPAPAKKSDIAGPAVGGVFSVLVIAAIAGAYLIYRRRHAGDEQPETPNELELRLVDGALRGRDKVGFEEPIPVAEFQAHCQRLMENSGRLMSEEYQSLPRANCMPYENSAIVINNSKNRYNNIHTYDHSRVILRLINNEPGSDYINANYIDGYKMPATYIACQGPLLNTCEDHWRMVWEQDISIIVMVTNCDEGGRKKCEQYWPLSGSLTFGTIQVSVSESTQFPNFTMSDLSILYSREPGKEKFVQHFHFTSWPVLGEPVASSLLTFLRRVNEKTPPKPGPILVHCSAGIGRTGIYIMLDVCLKRIAAENNVDVYGFLRRIRNQRNYLVQTESQYEFIHKAILEHLECGCTERIERFTDKSDNTHDVAMMKCNRNKNRFVNIHPYDDTRVKLRMMAGVPGSDYINANYIDLRIQCPSGVYRNTSIIPKATPGEWRLITDLSFPAGSSVNDFIPDAANAAGSLGFAAINGPAWFAQPWPKACENLSIAFKELIPIVLAAYVWGPKRSRLHVLFKCDNMAVVECLSRGLCKDKHLALLLRDLFIQAILHSFSFSTIHVPDAVNTWADLLSRLRFLEFLNRLPSAEPHPTPVPPITLHCLLSPP
eukprot:gene3701-4221_t